MLHVGKPIFLPRLEPLITLPLTSHFRLSNLFAWLIFPFLINSLILVEDIVFLFCLTAEVTTVL